MKKILVVALAALSLVACGKTTKTWSGPSRAELRMKQEKARVAAEGVAANKESIVGGWCALDEEVGTALAFAEDGSMVTREKKQDDQASQNTVSTYSFNAEGKLMFGDAAIDAKIAEANAESTKILSLSDEEGNSTVYEACEIDLSGSDEAAKQEQKQDEVKKEESKEEPKQEVKEESKDESKAKKSSKKKSSK